MEYTRTDTDAESRLTIEGSLDAHTVSDLRHVIDALARDPSRKVVVDIAALTMIDSSGIGLFVGLSKRLRAAGGGFRMVNVNGQPLMVIKVLKLEELFSVEASP